MLCIYINQKSLGTKDGLSHHTYDKDDFKPNLASELAILLCSLSILDKVIFMACVSSNQASYICLKCSYGANYSRAAGNSYAELQI